MWMGMVQGSGLWKFVEFIVTFLHHITQRKASTDCFASMPVLCKSKWNGSSEMIHNASCSKLNLMRFVHISQDGNDCVLAPPSAKNDKLYAKGFPLSKMRSHSLSFKIFKCVFVLEINFGGLTGFIISDSKYSQWTLLNSHYLPLLWK